MFSNHTHAPVTDRPLVLFRLLLSLAVLLNTTPAFAFLSSQSADGTFHGWAVSGVVPSGDVVYVLDSPLSIRMLNRTTGTILSPAFTIPQQSNGVQVESIAVDGRHGRVYALVYLYVDDTTNNRWLLSFTSELQYVGNMSLASLSSPPEWFTTLSISVLPVDEAGDVYVVRRLLNSKVLVHVISPDSQAVSTWSPPFDTQSASGWSVAMGPDELLYFQTVADSASLPTPLYVTTTDGKLQSTLYLNISAADCPQSVAVAVSRSNDIALACQNSLFLFDSSGQPVPSFRYISTLEQNTWTSFISVAFDGSDRLLAVASDAAYGVQVVSATSGDLLTVWSTGVPWLGYTVSFTYEARTDSLLALQSLNEVVVQRMEAERGTMLQEYRNIGRLQQCTASAMAVGESGNIHILAQCFDQQHEYGRAVLYTMDAAGQLRREMALSGWAGESKYEQLLVCEDKGLFYMLTVDNSADPAIRLVVAFALNGTGVFNATDPRIGNIRSRTAQLLRVNDNELAVVDTYNSRIALLDLDNGDFLGNLTVSNDTTLLSAVYDSHSESWFRSEVPIGTFSWVNCSVNQYAADGSMVAQYVYAGDAFDSLTIDVVGRRLYALDGYEAEVVWWNIPAQPHQQHTTTAAETIGAVRVVQASGQRGLVHDESVQDKAAGADTANNEQLSRGEEWAVAALPTGRQRLLDLNRGQGRVSDRWRPVRANRAEVV